MGFFHAKKDLEDFDGFQVCIPCLLLVLTTCIQLHNAPEVQKSLTGEQFNQGSS